MADASHAGTPEIDMTVPVAPHPPDTLPSTLGRGRRVVLVLVWCTSILLGAVVVAALGWVVVTAGTWPDRLARDAPRWAGTALVGLETAVLAVVLFVPACRLLGVGWRADPAGRRHDPASIPVPDPRDPREPGSRCVWWSRLSLLLPGVAAAAELVLRGRHPLLAVAVAAGTVVAVDLAVVAVHPARIVCRAYRAPGVARPGRRPLDREIGAA